MGRPLWEHVPTLIAGTTARAEQVNAQLEGVEGGFNGAGAELDQAIRLTGAAAIESTYQLPHTPAQRARLLLGFDAGGALALLSGVFTWRGDWAPGVQYNINDMVRAPAAQNLSIYVSTLQHVSQPLFSTDLGAGRWTVAIDLTQVERAIKKFQLVTASRTLVSGDDLFVDVSAAPIILTLPASPLISDQPIHICHVSGNLGTNPLTIARNGQRIMGLLEDMTVGVANAAFELAFCNASLGWRLVKGT